MNVAELLKNMSVDTPIPIFINTNTDIFLLNFYVHGYHIYMDVWNAIINDSVYCKNEEGNEFDTTAVALKTKRCWTRSNTFTKNILLFFEITLLQCICNSN